jgi:hypothetical protein
LTATIARGIADQILDDLLGQRYVAAGESPSVLPLGMEAGESSNPVRTILLDDTDDFHLVAFDSPLDPYGRPLGQGDGAGGLRPEELRVSESFLANWRVEIVITYVNESNPAVDLTGSATSGMRAATVTVTRIVNGTSDQLAQVRRVFSCVATPGS